jgi:hypothetical protein
MLMCCRGRPEFCRLHSPAKNRVLQKCFRIALSGLTKTGRTAPRIVILCIRQRLILQAADLIPDFEAVRSPAAFGPLAGAVGRAVAGVVALCPLNGVNQLRLFHISRVDAEIFGLLFYVGH